MPSEKRKKSNKNHPTAKVTETTAQGLDTFAGFNILPLHCPTTSLPAGYALHYLYLKQHEARHEDRRTPKGRTLFVANLPVDTTEEHLRVLFRPYGRVESVVFHRWGGNKGDYEGEGKGEEEAAEQEEEGIEEEEEEKELKEAKKKGLKREGGEKKTEEAQDLSKQIRHVLPSGSWAHIVFLEEKELKQVLAMQRKKRVWGEGVEDAEGGSKVPPLGLQKYLTIYNLSRPPPSTLQASVDAYMLRFTNQEYEREREALAQLNRMDEDGFTLVTRKGRRGHNTDGTITVTAARAEDVKDLKPKKKELTDFYRFQMREAKRDKLVELRRKFEEDKKKIEVLKSNRRFRPY